MISTETFDAQNPFFLHDMDILCAICNRKLDKDKTYSLQEKLPNSEPIINVLELLATFSKFNIDTGPDKLCKACFNNTLAAFKFQQMCNKSYEYITNYFKHQEEMKKIKCSNEEECDTNDSNEDICDNSESIEITGSSKGNNPGAERVKCKVCHNVYRADYMRSHMRIHTGEKPYQCEICNKSFTQKTSLTFHLNFHKNDRNYMCNYCGKAFNILGNLRVHLRVHTGERPYKCEHCNMTFTSHNGHRRHLLVHTKEKPYTCEVCAKGFNRMSNLRVHIKIHTNDKQHVCPLCGKAFIQAHSLQSHLRTHAKRDVYVVKDGTSDIDEPILVEPVIGYEIT